MLEPIVNLLKIKSEFIIEVKIIPNSRQQNLVEIIEKLPQQFYLKIKLTAIPEKGRANTQLIEFLSEKLNLPKSNLEIISGHTNPHKLIRIHALQ